MEIKKPGQNLDMSTSYHSNWEAMKQDWELFSL